MKKINPKLPRTNKPSFKELFAVCCETTVKLQQELEDARLGCTRLAHENKFLRSGWEASQTQLKIRPTIEKIVTEEVLPGYVQVLLLFLLALAIGDTCAAVFASGPYKVVEPYAVEIVKHDGIPLDRWNDCQQSYKDDRVEIRELRRKLSEAMK